MKRIWRPFPIVFVAAWCFSAPSRGQTNSTNPTQQELLDEVRALRAEVKDLRQQLDAQAATTRPAIPSAGETQAATDQLLKDAGQRSALLDSQTITAAYVPGRGAIIQSEDGNFLLHPWAYIQIRNVTNYRSDATGDGSDTQNGFEIPRMKLILDGNIVSPDLTYQFIWATSDTTGNLGLQDAWARYHIPATPFAVRGGNIRNPLDHEQILFGTKSMTPERSIVNNVLLNGDDIVKGVSGEYGFDSDVPLRAALAFTGGMRNFNTTFQPFPTNPATWGAAGRVEWKLTGDWQDYTQFTSLNDKQNLLVFGSGADFTQAGDTGSLIYVFDGQFNTPAGLSLYGAYLGRYTANNQGAIGTNGGATTGPKFDTYDSTVRLMAAYLVNGRVEPFIRYEFLNINRHELPATAVYNYINDITLGCNYYFYGHRAKFSGAVSYLPDGSPISNTNSDLLSSHGGDEVIVQVQFQLII
jgi:hypothetical protein